MPKTLQIFPIAQAQGIDAVSQPTWGRINLSNGGLQSSTITIASDKTSVTVGQTFKLTIEIKTNTTQINEYRIFLTFDPARLQVVDKDPNTAGTQITPLDQLFLVTDATQDNVVTNGEIKLIAKTQTGNAFQVNRIVAEVEFQAQTAGNTTIQIAQGSGKTALVRQNGTSLNFTTNSQIVNITTQQNNQNNNHNNNQNNNQTGSGGITQPPPVQIIPDTAIFEGTFGNFLVILIGVLLIITGVSLSRDNNKSKSEK